MIKTIQHCRCCGSSSLTDVIDLGYQEIQGAFDIPGEPVPPRRKISNLIVRCDKSLDENACGLVQAKVSVDSSILYKNYFYSSSVGDSMKLHLSSVVDDILSIKRINSGRVLDIASNSNELLSNYRSKGKFQMWGCDPSSVAREASFRDTDINVVNECYPTPKLSQRNYFDIITCLACFYDVSNPIEFLDSVKNQLKKDGIVVFELADWSDMVSQLAYDQILTEHTCHYSLSVLMWAFERAGLRIFDAKNTPTNGGSIMVFACHENYKGFDTPETEQNIKNLRFREFELALDEESTYQEFRMRVKAHSNALKELIEKINNEGKTVHLYGASTKANVILNFAKIGPSLIPYAAERNPKKIGGKTLSGIKMVDEETSRNLKPDFYLVGPYSFRESIIEREAEFIASGGKLIFPLPEISIYPEA